MKERATMPPETSSRPAEILLVEDNPADVELTREAMACARFANNLHVTANGVEALAFLRREGCYRHACRPDLILLDWHLPRKGGREVLQEIKADMLLKIIPVIVLTTSAAPEDIRSSYEAHANCFITKPLNFSDFTEIAHTLQSFWFQAVALPPREEI
jgi:two-component system response regulator